MSLDSRSIDHHSPTILADRPEDRSLPAVNLNAPPSSRHAPPEPRDPPHPRHGPEPRGVRGVAWCRSAPRIHGVHTKHRQKRQPKRAAKIVSSRRFIATRAGNATPKLSQNFPSPQPTASGTSGGVVPLYGIPPGTSGGPPITAPLLLATANRPL